MRMNFSSKVSERYSQEARQAVLSFFDADPDEYSVVWTANATAGLKLVGESFPFTTESSLILPVDAHNSVQGIRAFAGRAGAQVKYVSCMKDGGYDLGEAMVSHAAPNCLPTLTSMRFVIAENARFLTRVFECFDFEISDGADRAF